MLVTTSYKPGAPARHDQRTYVVDHHGAGIVTGFNCGLETFELQPMAKILRG
jgi:hypothetical protein